MEYMLVEDHKDGGNAVEGGGEKEDLALPTQEGVDRDGPDGSSRLESRWRRDA